MIKILGFFSLFYCFFTLSIIQQEIELTERLIENYQERISILSQILSKHPEHSKFSVFSATLIKARTIL